MVQHNVLYLLGGEGGGGLKAIELLFCVIEPYVYKIIIIQALLLVGN